MKKRAKRLHTYYKYTGFYKFVGTSIRKSLPTISVLIVLILCVDFFVIDLGDFFTQMTEVLSPLLVISVFFLSETLLGLIPPEIFIAWAGKMESSVLYLSILASCSYLGGLISYAIGVCLLKIPSMHEYIEVKMKKHLKNTKKWGGFLIIVGALLPIPFSITCMTGGIIKYPFKLVCLYGLFRFLRFILYALVIFNVV